MTSMQMKVGDLHPQVQKQVARMPTISLRNPLSRTLMKTVMAIGFRPQADANVRRHTVKLEHASVRVYEPVVNTPAPECCSFTAVDMSWAGQE